MNKLLSANLSRLWKNRIFWAVNIATAVFSVYICFANFRPDNLEIRGRVYLDDVFFIFYQFVGLFCAAGISLIVGTEYSDGTLRNKLIVGHRRGNIYFANCITSVVNSLLIVLLHMAVTCGVGYLLYGGFEAEPKWIIYGIVCTVLAVAVYASACVMIAMLSSNKAMTGVLSLVLMFGLIFAGSFFGSALAAPEMTYDNIIITENGVQYGDMVENPAYVDGVRRAVYQFFYDLLPAGQINQIYNFDFVREEHWFARADRWPFFSAALILAINIAGYAAFRRKDLK